jgi:histidinol-phosphate phosphatase family protein
MKVAFLDRDGVINKYPGDHAYVTSWKEFHLIPGSIEGIRKLNQKDFRVFVISNQAGVSKGLYSQKALDEIDKRMLAAFRKHKVKVDGIYYCTHREEDNCACRKPKTGLLTKALQETGISEPEVFFVGDSFIDMNTARNFGAKAILVFSGKEKISNRPKWDFEPDYLCDNLLMAAHYLCSVV